MHCVYVMVPQFTLPRWESISIATTTIPDECISTTRVSLRRVTPPEVDQITYPSLRPHNAQQLWHALFLLGIK